MAPQQPKHEEQSNVASLVPRAANEAIAVFNPQNFWPKDWAEGIKYAELLARAPTMLPKHIRESKDPVAETFAHIMFGFEVGLAPMQSLRAIYIVHGRAGMFAADQIAIVQKHPDCEKLELAVDPKTGNPLSDARSCTWVTKRRGRGEQRLTFTMAEAEQEGLVAQNAKYKTAPAVMLRWRCATRLLAFTWGDVLRGLEDRDAVEVEEKDGGWVDRVPSTTPPPPRQTSTAAAEDVPPHDPKTGEILEEAKPAADELSFQSLLAYLETASSPEDLQARSQLVLKAKAAGRLTEDERKSLEAAYKQKSASLKGTNGGGK